MEFGSIRRKNRISQPSRSRKTFSTSNLSCISCSSASVRRKTLYVTLPKDFGCEVSLEGRVVHVRKESPAHHIGIIQIGDYLRLVEEERSADSESLVKLQVTFGVLQVDSRPSCPLVIEIGNRYLLNYLNYRSSTSLGIALADFPANRQICITSIQPGSLADRCGFLKPGDCLTSVHIGPNETVPCSPYYTSYQIAQILRQLTSQNTTVKVTIVPFCEESSQVTSGSSTEDVHSGGSDSTLTLTDNCSFANNAFDQQNRNAISSRIIGSESRNFSNHSNCVSSPTAHRIEEEEEELNEENERVLALCLWKDRLYEDWGFSLVDESEVDDDNGENGNDETNESEHKVTGEVMKNDRARTRKGAIVFQIRPGGPAFVAGLRPGDRILQINERNVLQLESTMLVPILASLEDALNLVISRISPSQAN